MSQPTNATNSTNAVEAPLVFKAVFKDDIRRITVPLPNLEAVRAQLAHLFGAALPQDYVLKYEDSDGDMVRITSDVELLEAISLARNRTPPLLKLFVKKDELAAPAVAAAKPVNRAAATAATAGVAPFAAKGKGCPRWGKASGGARPPHAMPIFRGMGGLGRRWGDYEVLYCGPDANAAAAAASTANTTADHDGVDEADSVVARNVITTANVSDGQSVTTTSTASNVDTAADKSDTAAAAAAVSGSVAAPTRAAHKQVEQKAERLLERAEQLCDKAANRGADDDSALRTANKLSAQVEKLRARVMARGGLSDAETAQIGAQLSHALTLLQNLRAAAGSRFAMPAPGAAVVHAAVTCDSCNVAPIMGVRWKCAECADFDLCAMCEAAGAHAETGHVFLKLATPRCVPNHRPLLSRMAQQVNVTVLAQQLRARFINHETIPDRTEIVCGTPFTKVWRMRNVGDADWPRGTRLLFVGGDQLEARESTPLTALPAPNTEITVAVDMRAPSKPGKYTGFFRLATAEGVRFGHRVWVDIQAVQPAATATVLTEGAPVTKTPPTADPAFFEGTQAQLLAASEPAISLSLPTPAAVPRLPSAALSQSALLGGSSAAPASLPLAVLAPAQPEPAVTPLTLLTEARPVLAPSLSSEGGVPSPVEVPVGALAPVVRSSEVVGAVASAPAVEPATAAAAYVHARALTQLTEMGFSNAELLRTLLDGHGGDVLAVVRVLLGGN